MYLSKLTALLSLVIAVVCAETTSTCSGVVTNFVPVTAVPVTTTVSVPFTLSPSITGKHDVPSHLEVALDNTTEVTAALADDNTIIHIVPTVATNSTPAVAPKGLHYSNVKNGTQVCLDDQTLSEGNETEKLTKIAPAIANSSAVTISSLNSTRSSYTARLTNTGSSVAPVSLIATRSFGSFAEHFLNGWNTTFRTLLSQQTGVATVPSVTKAALIASKPFGSLAGYGLGGWNATSRTLLRENIVGSVNQPAELSSQPTGVNDNLLTRPGTGSFLAASTSSLNATNTKGAGQLGSVLVPTIKSIGVSRTKNPDGTALTLPFPVATASDPTAQNKLGIASERTSAAIHLWNLQSAGVRGFPTSSFGPSKPFSANARYQNVSTNVRDTSVFSNSSARLPVPTKIVTSAVPVLSVLSTSGVEASIAPFSNRTNVTKIAVTANSSCTGKANFTIDFDDLPRSSTSAEVVSRPLIVNPYRKLFFEEGHFGYVSLPRDPFPPVSPPQLAVYRTDLQVSFDGSSDVGLESTGEIGAGPRASDSAYWIDAFSLWLGCENFGASDCVITINGYDSDHSTRVASTTVTQPPCPGADCKLAFIKLPDTFRNLIGIHILATVDLKLTTYYFDDLNLGWSNNSCAAQQTRSSSA